VCQGIFVLGFVPASERSQINEIRLCGCAQQLGELDDRVCDFGDNSHGNCGFYGLKVTHF
jgi:hypothetical protein